MKHLFFFFILILGISAQASGTSTWTAYAIGPSINGQSYYLMGAPDPNNHNTWYGQQGDVFTMPIDQYGNLTVTDPYPPGYFNWSGNAYLNKVGVGQYQMSVPYGIWFDFAAKLPSIGTNCAFSLTGESWTSAHGSTTIPVTVESNTVCGTQNYMEIYAVNATLTGQGAGAGCTLQPGNTATGALTWYMSDTPGPCSTTWGRTWASVSTTYGQYPHNPGYTWVTGPALYRSGALITIKNQPSCSVVVDYLDGQAVLLGNDTVEFVMNGRNYPASQFAFIAQPTASTGFWNANVTQIGSISNIPRVAFNCPPPPGVVCPATLSFAPSVLPYNVARNFVATQGISGMGVGFSKNGVQLGLDGALQGCTFLGGPYNIAANLQFIALP